MDECKEVEIFKWIELTKDQKRILSTLADEEEIIKSLICELIDNIKNQMFNEKITVAEARGAKLAINQFARILKYKKL